MKTEYVLMNKGRQVLRFLCERNAFDEPEFSELEWHSRGQRFDPAYLHQKSRTDIEEMR